MSISDYKSQQFLVKKEVNCETKELHNLYTKVNCARTVALPIEILIFTKQVNYSIL